MFQHGSDSAVMCIIGNKCDADTRQVTLEEGLNVSERSFLISLG